MNTENKIAEELHQKTIDLQAVIIAGQQQDIDRLNSLAIDSAEEIARLNKVIEWLQGQTGKMMGAAAKAEAVTLGPILLGDERVAERRTGEILAEILAEYRNGERELPSYAELRELCPAAPAAPAEQAKPIRYDLMMGGMVEKSLGEFVRYSDCRPASAAPLPELTGQSAGSIGEDATFDDLLADYKLAESRSSYVKALAALVAYIDSRSAASPSPAPARHPDDIAVDAFADAMKAKMAKQRDKGYSGWESADCDDSYLANQLFLHAQKGDPVDVGNFAMMLHQRNVGGTDIDKCVLRIAALDFAKRVASMWIPETAPAQQQEPSALTDLPKRLRDAFCNPGCTHAYMMLFMQSADEIKRLHTAKSHLILQAQIWHGEAKSQRATVIGILARLGLPENDWEAKRLIVAHIAKLTGAPVPCVGGIASKESVEPAAPGASTEDKQ